MKIWGRLCFLGSVFFAFVGHAAGGGATLVNPASAYCVEQGGKLVIRQGPEGEYGVCLLTEYRYGPRGCIPEIIDSECEEWALLYGKCAPGECKQWAVEYVEGKLDSFCKEYQITKNL